jgi:hypothetical protein
LKVSEQLDDEMKRGQTFDDVLNSAVSQMGRFSRT